MEKAIIKGLAAISLSYQKVSNGVMSTGMSSSIPLMKTIRKIRFTLNMRTMKIRQMVSLQDLSFKHMIGVKEALKSTNRIIKTTILMVQQEIQLSQYVKVEIS